MAFRKFQYQRIVRGCNRGKNSHQNEKCYNDYAKYGHFSMEQTAPDISPWSLPWPTRARLSSRLFLGFRVCHRAPQKNLRGLNAGVKQVIRQIYP